MVRPSGTGHCGILSSLWHLIPTLIPLAVRSQSFISFLEPDLSLNNFVNMCPRGLAGIKHVRKKIGTSPVRGPERRGEIHNTNWVCVLFPQQLCEQNYSALYCCH